MTMVNGTQLILLGQTIRRRRSRRIRKSFPRLYIRPVFQVTASVEAFAESVSLLDPEDIEDEALGTRGLMTRMDADDQLLI